MVSGRGRVPTVTSRRPVVNLISILIIIAVFARERNTFFRKINTLAKTNQYAPTGVVDKAGPRHGRTGSVAARFREAVIVVSAGRDCP